MSSEEFPRKERDLLTSGSGASFFGAKAYVSTPDNNSGRSSRTASPGPNNKKGTPRRKPPPRSKSSKGTPKSGSGGGGDSSNKEDGEKEKERNFSLPVTQSDFNSNFIPNAEHGDMFHNRKVAARMEGNGVEVYQVYQNTQ
jgi:hypothetical protein